MDLKFDNRTPVYLQLIDYFKQVITSEEMALGEELPSRRELASRLKINPNTVQRACKEMEETGLIVTERNLPSKVTSDKQIIKQLREELINDAVDELIETVQSVNVPLEDLLQLVKQKYQ